MENIYSDEYFMKEALKEAQKAFDADEVPIGAIIVWSNKIIARGYNLTESLTDPTAHAEMQAITSATNYVGAKYLPECTMYVTLEPCVMCAGACYWAHLGKVVYGASDSKRGFSISNTNLFHPKTEIIKGVLEKESSDLITSFFKLKR